MYDMFRNDSHCNFSRRILAFVLMEVVDNCAVLHVFGL